MNKEKIQEVYNLITKTKCLNESIYSSDKKIIVDIFNKLNEHKQEYIQAKLTLIDSMYSTQMSKRYYGLYDIANVLFNLDKPESLKLRFINFAQNNGEGDAGIMEIFNNQYGINKDGEKTKKAISLISKYAYFETGFNFPIYDSIVKEMYPLIIQYCGLDNQDKKNSLENITDFIVAINSLIKDLSSIQPEQSKIIYDDLDKFLWHVGKIRRGNLSLILTQQEYQDTIKQYKTNSDNPKKSWNLHDADLDKLEYLQTNNSLKLLFKFATEISMEQT